MMKGFYMTLGNKGLFYEYDGINITDKIARAFINKICDYKQIGDGIRKKSLYDAITLQVIKKRICKATIEENITQSGIIYYTIKGDNFTENYPKVDYENDIITF